MFHLFTCLALSLAPAQPPALVSDSRPIRSVVCVLEFELTFAEAYQLNELSIVGAAAPDLPHHQTKVRTTLLSPRGGELSKEPESPFRPFVATRFRPTAKERTFTVKIQYEATLMERHLVAPGARKGAAIPSLEAKARDSYLVPTDLYDFKSPDFTKWLTQTGLQRGQLETPLAFAQRAYLKLTEKFTYKSATPGRPASQVIGLAEADCDNLSFVYIATLRANGVPARMLLGRSVAKSLKVEGGRMPGHAVTEFYADDVGWVYCEVSKGVSHRDKKPLQYFGHNEGHFLVMQVEAGMRVPGSKADAFRTVRSLTSPAHAYLGKGGSSEAKMTPISWTVTERP